MPHLVLVKRKSEYRISARKPIDRTDVVHFPSGYLYGQWHGQQNSLLYSEKVMHALQKKNGEVYA